MSSDLDYPCVLLVLTQTSSVHQYATGMFWGTCVECDRERNRLERECANRLDLRVARVEDAYGYTF